MESELLQIIGNSNLYGETTASFYFFSCNEVMEDYRKYGFADHPKIVITDSLLTVVARNFGDNAKVVSP